MASTSKTRSSTPRLSSDDVLTVKSAAALMRKDSSLSTAAALAMLGVRQSRDRARLTKALADSALLPIPHPRRPVATKKSTIAAILAPRARKGEPARGRSAAATAKPLLATTEKKVGPVSMKPAPGKMMIAKVVVPEAAPVPKAKPHLGWTPKADVRASSMLGMVPGDPQAMIRAWMSLGMQMSLTALTLNTRIARGMLQLPPTTMALRQGTRMMRAMSGYGGPMSWLSMKTPFGRD